MLFDPRPKRDRKDLFDMEDELERFLEAVEYSSLIVITGLRRFGKTSLMNVALKESGYPYVAVDLRGLPYNPSRADMYRKLEDAFSSIQHRQVGSLLNALRRIRGVSIAGNRVELRNSTHSVDLASLFERIDVWATEQELRFIAAFDEVQIIRGEKQIPRLFAHLVDTTQNLVLVATGSEIGFLYDFLGFEDPESPLYGRHYTEIALEGFTEEEASTFLREGFEEIDVQLTSEVRRHAVERLDGNVGWLTLLGASCRDRGEVTEEIVEEVASTGGKMMRAEAMKLAERSTRYGGILNFLARTGEAKWSDIKRFLESREGRRIPNSTFSNLLLTLKKTGFILLLNDRYILTDPLLEENIRQEALPER